ncbi:MAG TPA: flagellar assembly peptidoglycan hydrolase FlgJ [Gammaproteobacteria bacterium]|nr:flagellar assembly peptidoglycan hydrolase FlgJ [Gammaproteobacteria bacterium]
MTANNDIYLDMTGLARLKAEAHHRSPKALRAVAQQFEGLFVQMMLKSMRQASLAKGMLDNNQTKFYQGMFDKQVAQEISKRHDLGLTRMLVRQLGGAQPRPAGPAQGGAAQVSAPAAAPGPAPQAGAAAPSPAQFVAGVWPHAQRTARKLGVDPRLLVAQAALETGWGRGTIRRPDGSSSHNLFGIKADANWQGGRTTVPTLEVEQGIPVRRQAAFRTYPSVADSFADYARFLQGNPRYRQALERGDDPAAFARALQDAGYATDPDYARKIRNILNSGRFQDAVAQLKNPAGRSLS